MDVLYYSNYCKHSEKVIKFLSKGGLTNEINAFCIDKRTRDPKTNQTIILLEDGKKALLPPNLQSVPALLLIKDNYKLVFGDDIIKHFEPMMKEKLASADFGNGEPMGFAMQDFSGTTKSNIVSEQFTYYNLTPEELSAKGIGGRRQMYNYVTAKQDQNFIETPPDEYRPNKLDENVTVDSLQQQRNMDVPVSNTPQFQYKTMDL